MYLGTYATVAELEQLLIRSISPLTPEIMSEIDADGPPYYTESIERFNDQFRGQCFLEQISPGAFGPEPSFQMQVCDSGERPTAGGDDFESVSHAWHYADNYDPTI